MLWVLFALYYSYVNIQIKISYGILLMQFVKGGLDEQSTLRSELAERVEKLRKENEVNVCNVSMHVYITS